MFYDSISAVAYIELYTLHLTETICLVDMDIARDGLYQFSY